MFAFLIFFFETASCKGRCGAEYSRAYTCQCDYDCLPYGECCQDYEYQCTTSEAFFFFFLSPRYTKCIKVEINKSIYWPSLQRWWDCEMQNECSMSKLKKWYPFCCKCRCVCCATENSCKGRCGETFKRGRWCSCDADCVKFKQCCSDFTSHCDAGERFFFSTWLCVYVCCMIPYCP